MLFEDNFKKMWENNSSVWMYILEFVFYTFYIE